MPKGKTAPEIYLALFSGMKPHDIIKKGYKPHTVYAYSRRFKLVRRDYEQNILGVAHAKA